MHIKRILIAVFVILLIFAGCHPHKQSSQLSEVRAAWISYIELSTILDNRSEAEYVSGVKTMLENLKAMNFNTVYVHDSAFTDAYYPSQYYPAAQYVAGQIGQQVSYDPFGLFVEQAHQAGFHIEAWINPMRSFRTDQESQIPADCIIGQWLKDASMRGTRIVSEGDRWYLNPAYSEVRDLICAVAKELVQNYPIDGLHMDDYFYPDGVTADFDRTAYQAYQQTGGGLSLGDWRRQNINEMVASLYATVKQVDNKIQVGISPAGNLEYSVESIYGDVREWVSRDGYLDYILPQIYFGYEHGTLPFDQCLKQWEDLTRGTSTQLIVGLAAYKINTVDNYAKDGKYEWQQHDDILKRQIAQLREHKDVAGFSIFSYNSLFRPDAENAEQVSRELENVRELIVEAK